MKDTIPFSDFEKVDLRVGKIIEATLVDRSNKLIRLKVGYGDLGERVVLAGLSAWYKPEDLVGKFFVFVYNLEAKSMMGEESQGMILCVDLPRGPKLLQAPEGAKEGEKIR